MKIVKISDDLTINIESLYSLEKISNKKDINEWESRYNDLLNQYSQDPPLLQIDNDTLFKPDYGKTQDEELLTKYFKSLDNYIIDSIGIKPKYEEKYYIILVSGLKIYISKYMYDKVNEYLKQFE